MHRRKCPPLLPLRTKKEGPSGLQVPKEVHLAQVGPAEDTHGPAVIRVGQAVIRVGQAVVRVGQVVIRVGQVEIKLGLFVPSRGLNPRQSGSRIAPRGASRQ